MVAIPTGPYPQYDWIGSFSGGAQAVNLQGKSDGNLTLMYTGASRWPDNWKLPYKPQTEQQAIATSSDGGQTWQKYAGNPVWDVAPGGWNVTGFRDPIFSRFPELDSVLGYEDDPKWYIVLGSGIRGVGPRIPLFMTPGNDLTSWTFLGALFEVGQNVSWSNDEAQTGSFGSNFEMVGFYALPEKVENGGDGKTSHFTINMGTEGYDAPTHPKPQWSLFAFGDISRRSNGSAEMKITASGMADWGEAYAMNQFYDPVHDRRVLWAWADDLLSLDLLKPQGWAGTLTFPREIFVLVKHNVVMPEDHVENAPERWIPDGTGTYTVKIFGQRPLADVLDGIHGGGKQLGSILVTDTVHVESVETAQYHLKFTLPYVPPDGQFSMLVRATPDLEE
jgi:beta-fructofuranosidase